jgi:urease accessory protein
VARGEAFEYSSLSLTTRIRCAGEERAVDTLLLEPGRFDPSRPGVLGVYGYLGSLFAVAPGGDSEALARMVHEVADRAPGCLVGTGVLPSGSGILTRILASSPIAAGRALEATRSAARLALIGAAAPRVRK